MIRKVYMSKEEFESQNRVLNANLPYSEDLSILSRDYKIGNKVIPNRLACQAMEGCGKNT